MLESSKFVGSNLSKHNLASCWYNAIEFSGEFYNLTLQWSVKFYRIIFRVNKFIGKTKRVSVQLGKYDGFIFILSCSNYVTEIETETETETEIIY